LKPTPRRILALWRSRPEWQADLSDMRKALELKGPAQEALHAALEQLVSEGRLRFDQRRYRLPGGAAAPAEPQARHEGLFSAHRDGYGFVAVGALRQSLFIPPPEVGGALDGDWVRVESVPAQARRRSYGRITSVLERRRVQLRGRLHHQDGRMWLLPLTERLPDALIPRGQDAGLPSGTLVDAVITHFPENVEDYPQARVLGAVPDNDEIDQIIDNILANTALHLGFSPDTMAEMVALKGEAIPPPEGTREDLTALPFVTIDGEDARDFDDAVCLETLPGGHDRLWVAIADVAAYVRPGSAVDAEAYAKGTSVYFPARVLPMLPERLSNDLCSLRPHEPRPTLVCELELDARGEPLRRRVYEALIRSQARLTYAQVQRLFEGDADAVPAPALRDMLARMRQVAATLREKRTARGALGFVFPEARFALDAGGLPVRILRTFPTEATRLIEQFMLEANETVARHCEAHGLAMLYRVHDAPPADALQALVPLLWNAGVQVQREALETPQGISAVLTRLEQHPARENLELSILKSLAQAVYRETNDGHFALAATHYCHFTSPIRRYPDLLVHRALKAWLAAGRKGAARKPPLPPGAGDHLSAFERIAADAEGQVGRLYRVLYMEPRLGEEFAGRVVGLSERGLNVALRDEFVEGYLPLDLLRDDHYRFDARRNVLEGSRRRQHIGLGQRLVLRLVKAERHTQQMEFAWVRWGWDDAPEDSPGQAKPPHPKPRARPAAHPAPAPKGRGAKGPGHKGPGGKGKGGKKRGGQGPGGKKRGGHGH
jgi:ribonuclease R